MKNNTEQPAMYYSKTGSGPVIVLLHGFPDSGAVWAGIAQALATDYTLIIPDLPGSGKSPLTKETMLPEMADGIKQILDNEGVGKAIIAGHSMGGYVALAFAKSYPGSVSGLALIHSTPVADDEEKKKTRLKAIELIQNGGKEQFIKQMTGNLFAPAFKEANPLIVKEKTEVGMQVSDEGIINFYKAMMARADSSDVVKDAQFPLLWVFGAEDKIINYSKTLPFCHQSPVNFVTLYEQCGHMSMIEAPQLLIADLRQFAGFCSLHHPMTE